MTTMTTRGVWKGESKTATSKPIEEKPIFVVTMYRHANREAHSYLFGVFSTAKKALGEATAEEAHRGDSYIAEVLGFRIDRTVRNRPLPIVVKTLERAPHAVAQEEWREPVTEMDEDMIDLLAQTDDAGEATFLDDYGEPGRSDIEESWPTPGAIETLLEDLDEMDGEMPFF